MAHAACNMVLRPEQCRTSAGYTSGLERGRGLGMEKACKTNFFSILFLVSLALQQLGTKPLLEAQLGRHGLPNVTARLIDVSWWAQHTMSAVANPHPDLLLGLVTNTLAARAGAPGRAKAASIAAISAASSLRTGLLFLATTDSMGRPRQRRERGAPRGPA